MPCFMLLTGFANLFGLGGSSLISRCLGSDHQDRARHYASFCIWTGAAVATMLSNLIAMGYLLDFLYHIRRNSVITPNPKAFSVRERIPAEVLSVGLPGFVMTMMSTISNGALNHMVAGYSDTAIAGMGIAKKIDLLAYAIAQGMTQGTLPLIGYNYTACDHKRMKAAIKTAFAYSFLVACVGAVLLRTLATPISSCFIADTETVQYGQHFLKIICLFCPTTAVNFMVITVFQAIGRKIQPLFLSLLRKGSLDVVFMLILNGAVGVSGIAWATPFADWIAFVISVALIVPQLRQLKIE